MAYSSPVSLKLLIDTKNNKVLFAEAGKDFVDFLFTLLSLPIGTVIRLLTAKSMVGCLGNLYDSIENLSETYLQPNLNKDSLLNTKTAAGDALLLATGESLAAAAPVAAAAARRVYMCGNDHRFAADNPRAICPHCKCRMGTAMQFVAVAEVAKDGFSGEGGFVKGVVTYMVMDDLVVMPMSAISAIALLHKFNVNSVGALEEKVVSFGMDEGLKLLKESLQSKTALTSIFLVKKVA